ncbi:MAG: radical SAM protein [Deltaproteobacteria bacterium]|nr:radical SAM protein [Deltaproteobacteria bacterium]
MTDKLFLLPDNVELRVRTDYCLIVDFNSGAVEILHPSEAFIASFMDGRTNREDITYLIKETYNLTLAQAEALFDTTLKHLRPFLSISPSIQTNHPHRYDHAMFLIPGFEQSPGESEPLEAPLSINLVLTRQCNFRCRYCYFADHQPSGELRYDIIARLIHEARDLGVVRVDLGGGEPTMHSRFIDIITEITANHMVPSFSTNGFLLNDRLVNQLADAGLNHIQVSLDSPTAELHHFLTRTRDSFNRVVSGIKALKAKNFRIRTRSVITPDNWRSVGRLIDFLVDLGVDFIDITPELPGAYECRSAIGVSGLGVEEKDFVHQVVKEKSSIYSDRRIAFNINDKPWQTPDEIIRCGNLTSSMVIHPHGQVTVCEMLPDVPELTYGHVYQSALAEIWLGPEHRRVWAMTGDKNRVDLECAQCEVLSFCRTACFNLAKIYRGNFLGRDHRCPGPWDAPKSSSKASDLKLFRD